VRNIIGIRTHMESVESVRERVVPALRRHGVVRAGMFGSIARGDYREDSDVDVLVEFEHGKSLFDLVELQFELEEILGRKADVVTYAGLHRRIRDRVLREQVQLL
jgi:uncharacterized protein